MKQHYVLLAVVGGVLLLASCAGDSSSSRDESSAQAPASSADAAPAESGSAPQPTGTTLVTPTPPAPTATQIPQPVLARTFLPPEAVTTPWTSIWSAAQPTSVLPWVGIGHRWDPAGDNDIRPLAWSLLENGKLEQSDLPLPPPATRGYTNTAANVFGGQLAGGYIYDETETQATYWFRSEDKTWSATTDFLPVELQSTNNATKRRGGTSLTGVSQEATWSSFTPRRAHVPPDAASTIAPTTTTQIDSTAIPMATSGPPRAPSPRARFRLLAGSSKTDMFAPVSQWR